ncbi:MAG: ATP-binding cassette domain-containing protein [Acidobacteria bacterium]|nr:ATP-binding cassette domain-containing protein [Acidobacteriota bacterium]
MKEAAVDPILQLEGLRKNYGDHVAVDRLSFDVPTGSIFGLLGPNGAGKTTTIRMIMRVILPDAGRVLLNGEPVDDDRRRLIGYLPEERGLYRKMKVLDHLVFLGTVRGVPPGEAKQRASAWLEKFGLGDWATHKVEDLSKGMQQKVQLIGTILHRPRLLILDEPFSGLDPINARELKDLMLAMREEGVTIVLSTHVLPQVDELCDHICLINQARPILVGRLDEIRERFGGRTWEVEGGFGREELERLPQVEAVHSLRSRYLLDLRPDAAPRELLAALLELGEVTMFARFVPDLENIFIRAVEEDQSHAA